MKESIHFKLEQLAMRFEEVERLLSAAETVSDQTKFRNLSKEYAQLEPMVRCYHAYQEVMSDSEAAKEWLKSDDAELKAMAEEEIQAGESKKAVLEFELQGYLIPADPNDQYNVFLEIRAGTGGDEASLFAGDLFRMYTRYAETMGWTTELISASNGEHGGYKEVITRVCGQNVYEKLKFESGVHRVQRVPTTESQGRVHTSACTVAVLPEAEAIDEIEILSSDLKIDTYRASGAGGQHVNKTDSAIRITHLPSGLVVECQDERSQHKNRARAMSLLHARLLDRERTQQADERAQTRRQLVGSGDRSERIRTYNYPQGRLTDHRINLTIYKLADVMEGSLSQIIDPLIREHQIDQLAAMADEY